MENGVDSTKVQFKLIFANDDNTKDDEIGGKDGADQQRLSDTKILDLQKIGVPAVHVQGVPKAMAVAVENKKKQGSACACVLM
eukprot:g28563.t1